MPAGSVSHLDEMRTCLGKPLVNHKGVQAFISISLHSESDDRDPPSLKGFPGVKAFCIFLRSSNTIYLFFVAFHF